MWVYTVCVQVPTETREAYKPKNHTEKARTLTTLWKINDYCSCHLTFCDGLLPSTDFSMPAVGGHWELRHSWCQCTLDSCWALLAEVEHIHIIALTEKVHIGIKTSKAPDCFEWGSFKQASINSWMDKCIIYPCNRRPCVMGWRSRYTRPQVAHTHTLVMEEARNRIIHLITKAEEPRQFLWRRKE